MLEPITAPPVTQDKGQDGRQDTGLDKDSLTRMRFHVQGIVQGVGFRPFVYGLARRLELSGFVYNDMHGVCIEVEGPTIALTLFQQRLVAELPPVARIEALTAIPLPAQGTSGFAIGASQTNQNQPNQNVAYTLASPDLAVCDDCVRELFDPTNRRYRYPFINCTHCGPRFTIIRGLPYDRAQTTMDSFVLCPACRREYESPENRRFHAQPNACPVCGPQLEFRWANDLIPNRLLPHFAPDPIGRAAPQGEAALQRAQQVLIHGGIVAIKGIGGFHLACDAANARAVARLRQRKQRGDKPFAVMARDLATVQQVAEVEASAIDVLTSRQRPVVLLKKRASRLVCEQVAPHCAEIGVMLPYAPLHHLLFAPLAENERAQMPALLVMTSGNLANEPIVTGNDEALNGLATLADALLLHNRPIHMPCDDSVLRLHAGEPLPLRRARGYAPLPLQLPFAAPPLLAVGGELKNAFCLAQGKHAFLSQHIGDMQGIDTLENFERILAHFKKLFGIEPEIVACDLHPAYLSTAYATRVVESAGGKVRLLKIQHHHAHLAALMAEHALPRATPVIGFCFDGTGYGPDGAIWGGEVMVADYRHYERVTHLQYFPLPGGDAAIRHPYRAALAALWAVGLPWDEQLAPVAALTAAERTILQRQIELGLNCVATSSMGRLFDVIAALAHVRQSVSYEAQAAMELEALVNAKDFAGYRFGLPSAENACFDAAPLLGAVVSDALHGATSAQIATRFHNAVIHLIVDLSLSLRARTGIDQVALTGGVFQNLALLRPTVRRLQAAGITVLVHRRVPPNDGGLALGQAVIAAAQMIDL